MKNEQPNFAERTIKTIKTIPLLLVIGMTGCATQSTIQSRIQERAGAFAAYSPEMKTLVEQGRIEAGMDTNAVYIAWGKPDEILESGDRTGSYTSWIYRGGYLEESRYWVGRQAFPRFYYEPRTYVRSEIVFFNGLVQSWRTYPEPPN